MGVAAVQAGATDRGELDLVIVTGISGGAKIATLLAIDYPDVFDGAIPIVGVLYFRGIQPPDQPNKVWPATIVRPPITLFRKAQQQQRYVLITGSNDFNHDPVKQTYLDGFVKDGYKYSKLLDIEGMGHSLPETQYMDEALAYLDEPLEARLAGAVAIESREPT